MVVFTDKANDTRTEASELLQPHRSSRPQNHFSRLRGWRVTVTTGVCLTSFVLVANIAILVWAHRSASDSKNGLLTVYTGDCSKSRKISKWSHLGVNILATLLLSASTACMQCVSAPTRKEIDVAHQHGVWLHIGVLGSRNFTYIPNWRRFVWILLGLSSVLIHLLYNSIIFATDSANDYNALFITSNFLTGGKWNISDDNNFDPGGIEFIYPWQVAYLQDNIPTLTHLEPAECLRKYSPDRVSKWRNVLIVTDANNEANSLLYCTTHDAEGNMFSGGIWCMDWFCIAYSDTSTETGETNWRLNLRKYDWNSRSYIRNISTTVQYCLAQEVTPSCRITLSRASLVSVIVCNILKVVCLVTTMCVAGFQPLVTVGDAIASFLTEPDPTTKRYGPVSAAEIMRTSPRVLTGISLTASFKPWVPARHFWFAAASRLRWSLTILCCIVVWTICLCLLIRNGSSAVSSKDVATNLRYWWTHSLDDAGSEDLIVFSQDQRLASNVLLVNTPQLLISLIYILYNGVFTCMLLTKETLGFATKRKTLRVSSPSGAQRSTYWLQLPYRYAIPLMVAMSLLHWLVSQSLFLIRFAVIDSNGREDPTRGIYGCGWSPIALLLSIILGGIIFLSLIANGLRRYTSKMPIMSSCSMAISAACHKGPLEDEDLAVMPLQYGLLVSDGGPGMRVGFSGRKVEPCVEGVMYSTSHEAPQNLACSADDGECSRETSNGRYVRLK